MSEIDFSAWEAPPPPDGLADAVVARMAEPVPQPEPAARRRRWVIAASAVAVLAIAGGVWAITRPRAPAAPDHGEVIADKAQHLELGGVSVDLDRGADVRWRRTRLALEVEQRAGAASWRVGRDQHVMIGATVAAIDATGDAGASLRVEVPMNPSDARVIGASAATAAAVAMVTVVVYEGHVKVASGGQTVVVQPGSTFTVPAPAPAPVPAPVVGAAAVAPGTVIAVLGFEAGPGGDKVAADLTTRLREWVRADASRHHSGPAWSLAAGDKLVADEKQLHHCADEAPACMAALGADLGVDAFVYGRVTSRRDGYEVTAKRFVVEPGAFAAESVNLIPAGDALAPWADSIAADLFEDAAGAKQPAKTRRWASKPPCDSASLISEANRATAAGNHEAALDGYEEAIECKPEERTERLAFMAACNAVNVPKAREHWGKLSAASQTQVLQLCVRNGITRDQLDPCDADALTQKGMDAEAQGQHGAALAQFETALKCKASERLYSLAFMAACNMKNVAKARQYWGKLPPASARTLKQMCMRNGITEDMLGGGPAAPAPPDGQGRLRIESVPAAKILVDGTEIGTTPVIVTAQPGKHKVTYVVGADRYTYAVTVKAGETETLSKDLQ